MSQFHDPAAGLNFSPNPEREVKGVGTVVLRVVLVDSVSMEFWVGEANPGKRTTTSRNTNT